MHIGSNAARAARNLIVPVLVGVLFSAGNVAFAAESAAPPAAVAKGAAPAKAGPKNSAPVVPAIVDPPAPVLPPAPRDLVVQANTEVVLTPVDEISSKTAKMGDKVKLVTLSDVLVDGAVAIPKGTPGMGEITYRKGTGSFGKSGKLELTFTSLDVSGKAVPLTGKFQQIGEGNVGGTVAAVVAAGVIGGAFVTGHSSVIKQGQELHAHTGDAATLPELLAPPAEAVLAPPAAVAAAAAPAAVTPAVATKP